MLPSPMPNYEILSLSQTSTVGIAFLDLNDAMIDGKKLRLEKETQENQWKMLQMQRLLQRRQVQEIRQNQSQMNQIHQREMLQMQPLLQIHVERPDKNHTQSSNLIQLQQAQRKQTEMEMMQQGKQFLEKLREQSGQLQVEKVSRLEEQKSNREDQYVICPFRSSTSARPNCPPFEHYHERKRGI